MSKATPDPYKSLWAEKEQLAANNGRRRLVRLLDPNGQQVGEHIDVTDIPNQNILATFTIEVTERCNLGTWHVQSSAQLPPWGGAISG